MTVSKGLNIRNKGTTCSNHPDKPAHARGLCKNCYNKRLLKSNTTYAKQQRNNYNRWVKQNLERHQEYQKIYREKLSPAKKRDAQLKHAYGISLIDYQKLAHKQNYKCRICLKPATKTLHVDHDHKTGKVRGLLCFRCNYGLGYFKDSLKHFKQIIKYLEVSNV